MASRRKDLLRYSVTQRTTLPSWARSYKKAYGRAPSFQLAADWKKLHPGRPRPSSPAAPAPGPKTGPFFDTAATLPETPEYAIDRGRIDRDLHQAEADITARELETEREFGFNDVSNPYSRAAMLKQSYERSRGGAEISLAGRGQLYAGSFQNEMATQRGNYEQGVATERKNYQETLNRLARARADARQRASDLRTDVETERLAAISRPPEEESYSDKDSETSSTPPSPAAGPKAAEIHRLRVLRRGTKGSRREQLTRQIARLLGR